MMAWGRRFKYASAAVGLLTLASFAQGAPPQQEKPPISIYEIQPVRDGTIIGATALFSLYPTLNGHHYIHIQNNPDPEGLIPIDQNTIYYRNVFLDNLSDATAAVAVAAPAVLDFLDVGWNKVLYEDLVVYAQTLLVNQSLTTFFKSTTQRPIPRVYAGDPTANNTARGFEGFYSGHTSTTLCALSAAALTLDLRHDAGVWPWLVVAAVGASVAVERVQAGEHFPTQVIAGALMGPLVGTLVPWLHKVDLGKDQKGKSAFSLTPAGDGAALTWNTRF
jgi:membrane-associated phospholipid phosphatase